MDTYVEIEWDLEPTKEGNTDVHLCYGVHLTEEKQKELMDNIVKIEKERDDLDKYLDIMIKVKHDLEHTIKDLQ